MRLASFKHLTLLCSTFFMMLTLSTKVLAEDIELYLNALLEEKEKPRVMLMFDTSGSMNWSSQNGESCYNKNRNSINCVAKTVNGKAYQCRVGGKYNDMQTCPASRLQVAKEAVTSVIGASDDVEFGIGVFDGGVSHIVSGIGRNSTTELKTIVNNLDAGSGTPITDSAYQVYSYFSGGPVFELWNLTQDRDTSIENNGIYTSPFANLTGPNGSYQPRCDNNAYFIMMTDGDPSSNTSYNNAAGLIQGLLPDERYTKATYEDENGDTKTLGDVPQHFPRLAEYMANNDVYKKDNKVNNVFTYTIGFGNGMSAQGEGMLKAAAKKGKGNYYDTSDPTQLNKNLTSTLNQILELSGNFTSPSVAASQSDSTRTKEFVYYSLFSPVGSARWNGNIKKLKINGYNIVDQDNVKAINSKGEIEKKAKTFWRDFNPTEGEVPSEDGGNVALGGLEDQVASPDDRKIFTDKGDFVVTNTSVIAEIKKVLKNHNGVDASDQDAKEMIDWMRGIESRNGDEVVLRNHILGDALHSKPAAITYGDADNSAKDSTYLIFGTNAGFVHFFEDTSETVATEVWSFIPTELFNIQPSLKDNVPGKVYGMDLTPTIYHDDKNGDGKVNAGEDVWAFFGMRRGGSSYYALNISDRSNPKLLWQKSSSSTGYGNLGQTWSQPKVIYINHPTYSEQPMLVFGAGYDKHQYENGAANTVGAGIYLVDAKTGDVVWSTDKISFDGTDSIVGRIATLDTDYDGYTDRLYAADTGGKIWRVDLAGSDFSDWSAFEFASLPGPFFYQPEVARSYYSKVTSYEENGDVLNVSRMTVPFEAVVIGSGDRTNPLGESNDNLFMLRDLNVITRSFKTDIPSSIKVTDLMSITPDTFGSLTSDYKRFVEKEFEYNKSRGWKYELPAIGEKALAKPAIIGGVAYFPTFVSGSETVSCSLTGGEGRLYAFHLHYAVSIYDSLFSSTGDSIPPTPELVFSEDSDENSQFLLIGIGAGEGNSGIIKAKSINDSAIPKQECDENGANCKINLVGGFGGLKAHRSYMYRESKNKVN